VGLVVHIVDDDLGPGLLAEVFCDLFQGLERLAVAFGRNHIDFLGLGNGRNRKTACDRGGGHDAGTLQKGSSCGRCKMLGKCH